ncbi:C40 family peptidase [Mahella australiensis]|uniref:NLP/P60 protein n=1 Tax=Mahella australiensis (strain DSM 15567 / CIP 107919 / 50-1 BON) TaxID=697281 RepID=F4A2M5_MAHA5|nr:NlpC/P60 family protein [Mahella australiensis]AEE96205.1 NLP/P60 protein [Mahella australiensis 50-1 BON]
MNQSVSRENLLQVIEKYKRVPFVHNGRSMDGLDCLGFVVLFYKEFGIYIPDGDGTPIGEQWFRDDPERYIRGIKALDGEDLGMEQLQPLDLVYFTLRRHIINHTGIMISKSEFVHMFPKKGLMISQFDLFWKMRFRGGKRLI